MTQADTDLFVELLQNLANSCSVELYEVQQL